MLELHSRRMVELMALILRILGLRSLLTWAVQSILLLLRCRLMLGLHTCLTLEVMALIPRTNTDMSMLLSRAYYWRFIKDGTRQSEDGRTR